MSSIQAFKEIRSAISHSTSTSMPPSLLYAAASCPAASTCRTTPRDLRGADRAPRCRRAHVVYSGGSEQTIYGDPEVNFAFRAWHDWCHWRGATTSRLRASAQRARCRATTLSRCYGESRQHAMVAAHSAGRDHRAAGVSSTRHGVFPEDQRAFAEDYLGVSSRLAAE